MVALNLLPKETFKGLLEMELKRSQRYQNFASVLLVEAYQEERVNQINGSNDHLSQRVAALMRSEIRETDLLGSFDENVLMIVLLHSDTNTSVGVAHRLGTLLGGYLGDGEGASARFCVGGACFPTHATDLSSICQRAQQMLEKARDLQAEPIQFVP